MHTYISQFHLSNSEHIYQPVSPVKQCTHISASFTCQTVHTYISQLHLSNSAHIYQPASPVKRCTHQPHLSNSAHILASFPCQTVHTPASPVKQCPHHHTYVDLRLNSQNVRNASVCQKDRNLTHSNLLAPACLPTIYCKMLLDTKKDF